MAMPSVKSEGIEQIIEKIAGFSRRDFIKANRCVPPPIGCGGLATKFRDQISQSEYRFSGLCQKCQDAIFGEGEA